MKGFALHLGLLLAWLSAVAAAEPLSVYTVNYPLTYFAERIAGEHAEVVFPAPAGRDPAFWQPSITIIGEYQRADLILLNGADYARWVTKVSLPRARLVDTSKAFAEQLIAVENAITHSHGPEGEHSHTGMASTTWLDFQQAALQAQAIAAALSRQRPALQATFTNNLQALEQDLAALDRQLTELVTNQPALPLLASHPVYQYLARRYGLKLRSLQWEPQQLPDESQWQELAAILQQYPARWMIWEAEPAPTAVVKLSELGVQSVVFDPCANVPPDGDWLSVMQANVKNLKPVFAQ